MEFHQLYPYKLFNRSKNISKVLLTDIFEIQMYSAFDDEVRIGSSKKSSGNFKKNKNEKTKRMLHLKSKAN